MEKGLGNNYSLFLNVQELKGRFKTHESSSLCSIFYDSELCNLKCDGCQKALSSKVIRQTCGRNGYEELLNIDWFGLSAEQ